MNAGRELDYEVAQATGWEYVDDQGGGVLVGIPPNGLDDYTGDIDNYPMQPVPCYSTDIAITQPIFDAHDGWMLQHYFHDVDHWVIYDGFENMTNNIELSHSNESAAHAICLAALSAVGVDV